MDSLMGKGFLYLAGPYTNELEAIRVQRFEALTCAAAWLLNQGHIVHSPITQGHAITDRHALPLSWDPFWKRQSLGMLEQAVGLVVLRLDGWQDSVGTQAEIEHAEAADMPVFYLNMADLV